MSGGPLDFGEGNVRGLNVKRPGFWVLCLSIVAIAAVGIALAACHKSPAPQAAIKSAADIRWDVTDDVPQAVRDYALERVYNDVEYYNSLGYNISDAKVTAMTRIETGTASLEKSIELWLLEYRLLPEDANRVTLAGGMQMEDGWLTEWSSAGQPYLLLLRELSGMEETWHRICVTNTDVITQDYGTPEMLELYGNEFTAAAMELYKNYLETR